MRIVFLGTPEFAAHSLKVLHEANKNIVGVITAPDRKAGRGQNLQSSAVKEYAVEHGIPCLQPTNLKDPDFLKTLSELRAELQIVVAFRMLPEVVWNMPKFGTMNLHASLLPYYRGAAPINWAIINGESKTGITTFLLKHEIDTGEVLSQEEVVIDAQENAGSLHDKLMQRGAQLLLNSTNQIESGEFKTIPQSELIPDSISLDELPHAPKIFREDCKIDWSKEVNSIDQLIRGLSPYPAAWTQLKRKKDGKLVNLKIYSAQAIKKKGTTSSFFYRSDNKLLIEAADGYLELNQLQIEGKKKMNIADFLNGINLEEYEEDVY